MRPARGGRHALGQPRGQHAQQAERADGDDRDRVHQYGQQQHQRARAPDVLAQRHAHLLAQCQHAQAWAQQDGAAHAQQCRRQKEADHVPVGPEQRAGHPFRQRHRQVARQVEQQDRRDRRKHGLKRNAHQQRGKSAGMRATDQPGQQQGNHQPAAQGGRHHQPAGRLRQKDQQQHHDGDGALAEAEQAGVGQRIAGDALQQCARNGHTPAGQPGHQQSGQAQLQQGVPLFSRKFVAK